MALESSHDRPPFLMGAFLYLPGVRAGIFHSQFYHNQMDLSSIQLRASFDSLVSNLSPDKAGNKGFCDTSVPV
jgi:hypothetical protein